MNDLLTVVERISLIKSKYDLQQLCTIEDVRKFLTETKINYTKVINNWVEETDLRELEVLLKNGNKKFVQQDFNGAMNFYRLVCYRW